MNIRFLLLIVSSAITIVAIIIAIKSNKRRETALATFSFFASAAIAFLPNNFLDKPLFGSVSNEIIDLLTQGQRYVDTDMLNEAKVVYANIALQNNPVAQCNLGYINYLRIENEEDTQIVLAEECYLKAIKLGSQKARCNLLALYLEYYYSENDIAQQINEALQGGNATIQDYVLAALGNEIVWQGNISAEDIPLLYQWSEPVIVVTNGTPSGSYAYKYEFVGYDWSEGGMMPRKLWKKYTNVPIAIESLNVGFDGLP